VTYIEWLETVTGRSLLLQESAKVSLALESIFGDQFLQIGAWGGNEFRQFARTKRTAVSGDVVGAEADLVMAENCLAIANDSIDIILLPHVLETSNDPHGVLRELDRILRSDGHVVILGFNPVSLWGLRHLMSRRKFPPGFRRLISEHRLRDWLRLLNFSVDHSSFHYFQAPLLRRSGKPIQPAAAITLKEASVAGNVDPARRSNRFFRAMRLSISAASEAWRRHAPFAGCYMLVARKALYTATPIRPVWTSKRRLVGGLVNPSTRNVA
jgi:SAM-dependent methyltransferase